MNLTQLAQEYLDVYPTRWSNTTAYNRLLDYALDEQRAESTLANIFWQAAILTDEYRKGLIQLDIEDPYHDQSENIVVGYGEQNAESYGLVVLHPEFVQKTPQVISIRPELSDFEAAYLGWRRTVSVELERFFAQRRRFIDSDIGRMTVRAQNVIEESIDYPSMQQLWNFHPFRIIVARKPRVEKMSIPSPSWGVSLSQGSEPAFTAGVVVRNIRERSGVTGCLHGLQSYLQQNSDAILRFPLLLYLLRPRVWVNDEMGFVRDIDVISDSCFIELTQIDSYIPHARGSRGPLIGKSPRHGEPVTFEGVTSGLSDTVISSQSPEIPNVKPYNQLKIYTPAVTSPGDSGAALVDGDDYVLGFCFERTGLEEDIEYTSWIWAHSVYTALGLEL